MPTNIPSLPVLKLISKRLSQHNIAHALGGSGLLYVLGLIKNVKDWDIISLHLFYQNILI